MKNLIKFFTAFMIFTAFNNVQAWIPKPEILGNTKFPQDLQLNGKTLYFELPKYDEKMYLYLIYFNQSISERFEIIDQNRLSVSLINTNSLQNNPAKTNVQIILAPKEEVNNYLNKLENINGDLKKLNNETIQYNSGKLQEEVRNLYKKRALLEAEYDHKFVQVASLNLSKTENGQKIKLPEYTPNKPFVSNVPAHPTASAPSPILVKQSNEKILTIRIPAQELKVGITLD